MKNCKFRIYNEKHSELIQERLFELGCLWARETTPKVELTDKPFLVVRSGKIMFSTHEEAFFIEKCPEMTLEELFAIPSATKFKLNDEYTAKLDGDIVKVGCQVFDKGTMISFADWIYKNLN